MNALLLATLAGCDGSVSGVLNQDTDVADTTPPVIEHDAITTSQPYGLDVLINATVTDDNDVFVVELVYQQETAVDWDNKEMLEVGGGLYQGTIPGDDLKSGGMRYFLRAWDEFENESCLPEGCELDAWHFGVSAP